MKDKMLLDTVTPNPNLWQKDNSKKLVVIDAGHGGLDASGRYTTLPVNGKFFNHKNKALNFHDIEGNSTFFEGVNNRILAKKLQHYLAQEGISSVFCFDFVADTPLADRCKYANTLHKATFEETVFISLHSNAGRGNGWEVHTSVGRTKSDLLATHVFNAVESTVLSAGRKMRKDMSDGDIDYENNFYVLKNAMSEAILIEHDFFDTIEGATLLNNKAYQNALMQAEARGIAAYLNL
jgi:N-acetylmuramoyl-L-alanine amidase